MADQIMAESKPRKPGLLWRIVWWLWVILLTALLVLGFVFATPWKVITLIAIFLAAATILPRIYRKWFWLAVGLVVLLLIVWIFLPEDNKDWKPYQFDKELAQLQAKYAVPDSENAAILYNQILADWKQKEANEPNLPDRWLDLTLNGPWLSKDQPEIESYIQYHKNTIEAVLYATKIEKCSFPIVANLVDYNKDMDRFPTMRKWAYLLAAAGNNDIAEGNANEAIEKYLTIIRFGQHLCQQPTPINMLVGIALEALAMGCINDFVVCGDANELYLDMLEQAVSAIKHDWNKDLLNFITLDKLNLKNEFGSSFYEVNSKGNIRFSRDPSAKIRNELKKRLADGAIYDYENKAELQKFIIDPGYWQRKLMKAYIILYWFYIPSTPEKFSEIVDAGYERYCAMTKPDFDWSKEPNRVPIESIFQFKINFSQLIMLLTKMNEESYFSLHDLYLRKSAEQRGTLLIIAMRRYKNVNAHWPEKLEDVNNLAPAEVFVDPMNNSSFIYKRTDDSFTLYSKGKNGIDEGGRQDSDNEDECVLDDMVFWPAKWLRSDD
jgi:hypothetical protein